MKRSILVALLVFMSMFTVVMILPETARATTLYVGGAGPGNYTTIQAAIDAAVPGDIVYVYTETYYEHVALDKTLSLVGEDRNTTVLDGSGTGVPLNITADWVNVTGFNFTNSGTDWEDAGLELYAAHNCNISHNIFQDSMEHIGLLLSDNNTIIYNEVLGPFNGIVVSQSSDNTIVRNTVYSNGNMGIYVPWGDNNTISNNTVVGNDDGIMLGGWANHTLVIDNNISLNGRYGLALWGASYSTVHNNTMLRNGWSTYRYGIYLAQSHNNTLSYNEVHESASINIYLNYSNNNTLEGNNVSNSSYGVHLYDSHGSTIAHTTAYLNDYAGIDLVLSDSNEILNNTVRENKLGVNLAASTNNIVGDSNISDNRRGIGTDFSDFTVLLNNTVQGNIRGIWVKNSNNDTIRGNNVSNNGWYGISIESSGNTTIADNTVLLNGYHGIFLDRSEALGIVNNTIASNGWYGIAVSNSVGIVIRNSTIIEDGIDISGLLDRWNTHTIDTTNTVNGRPVRYWKNLTGGTVPMDAGQVILANCTGVTVEAQAITQTDTPILLGWSSLNTITDNALSSNFRTGIVLSDNSHDNLLDNNSVVDSSSGIGVYSSNRNTVTNSNFSGNDGNGALLSGGHGHIFANNTISGNTIGVYLSATRYNAFSGNTMVGNGFRILGPFLRHWNTHSIDTTNTVNGRPVRLLRNTTGGLVPSDAGQVILVNSTNVLIENQNTSSATVGIMLGFSSNNTIRNSTGLSNSMYGIFLCHSNGTVVEGNNVSHNDIGIRIYDSLRSTVIGNDIGANSIGMRFGAYSDETRVDANRIFNNTEDGIDMRYSNTNTIVGNDIVANRVGINLTSSDSNMIFHNNIVDNVVQALDDSNMNAWDDGYPSGGNYWSDYVGLDDYSGPNQDQPGNDGIGDTPYSVDINGMDNYPLMSPHGIPSTRPPVILDAGLDGMDLENVTLSWSVSPDDGGGLISVVAYEIHRNTTYDRSGLGYQLIATLPNGTTSFTDSYAGEGDASDYLYIICALDSNNTTACSGDQAGKFTRPLVTGPNLVSIPLVQSETDVEKVLQTATFDMARTYRPYDPNDKWKYYMPFKPYRGDLSWLNHTQGFWINATENCNLTVAGLVPLRTSIQLFSGWNLVSFPSFSGSFTVADLKAATPVERVEMYDPASPPHYLRIALDSDVLKTGEAYWIKASWDAVWIVEGA